MSATPDNPRCFAVVPAAGTGSRIGGTTPKQYRPLGGRPLIEHTLERLLAVSRLEQIVVALAGDDIDWPDNAFAAHLRIATVLGGKARAHSVLNGLAYLADVAAEGDWVLVHDVARPCVDPAAVSAMIEQLITHPVGGILAVPVSDTVKRVEGSTISATVDRSQLWQAQTPQMFRLGPLRRALQNGIDRGAAITDEASAMELAGWQPLVVEGGVANLKVTRPEDLMLAEYYLARRAEDGAP